MANGELVPADTFFHLFAPFHCPPKLSWSIAFAKNKKNAEVYTLIDFSLQF
jgi:hypothetical protein